MRRRSGGTWPPIPSLPPHPWGTWSHLTQHVEASESDDGVLADGREVALLQHSSLTLIIRVNAVVADVLARVRLTVPAHGKSSPRKQTIARESSSVQINTQSSEMVEYYIKKE